MPYVSAVLDSLLQRLWVMSKILIYIYIYINTHTFNTYICIRYVCANDKFCAFPEMCLEKKGEKGWWVSKNWDETAVNCILSLISYLQCKKNCCQRSCANKYIKLYMGFVYIYIYNWWWCFPASLPKRSSHIYIYMKDKGGCVTSPVSINKLFLTKPICERMLQYIYIFSHNWQ